ncbi:hypothetical protein NSE01_30530 [Novosphingobium sediminis]|uniref:Uncharacterized protein n=1 Tax=Novosphingobium sediminis TaxID=707214 RepID=A0A512ANF5_9SPHN|nr:hypothetical protein NSE01_30530 [Novosphingobium sediminis]
MVWHTLPRRDFDVPVWDANYRLANVGDPSGKVGKAVDLVALIEPYSAFFAYGIGAGGNAAMLIEGLLRLETCCAALDAAVAPLWQDLARKPLTVAEDADKQRMDRLFGLDGKAGLLGVLRRNRQTAARDLPAMSSVQQAEFLAALLSFADSLLPDGGGEGLWPTRGTPLALPLYLQALALIVLVQGWIGGQPGAAEQAAVARHRAFLLGGAQAFAPDAATVACAAAEALRG